MSIYGICHKPGSGVETDQREHMRENYYWMDLLKNNNVTKYQTVATTKQRCTVDRTSAQV